ncbi:MAG: hypothetical protein M3Z24_04460 [Chloroflexota bacterium]|nr:hypothetical protein [Chloroflexota bacterium]
MRNVSILGSLLLVLSACSTAPHSTPTVSARVNGILLQMSVKKARESGFPAGTKIYGADLVTIDSGKTEFVPANSSTVSRTANGGLVVKDYDGDVVQSFPPTARLNIVHNGRTQAVRPDESVPPEYRNATPLAILK